MTHSTTLVKIKVRLGKPNGIRYFTSRTDKNGKPSTGTQKAVTSWVCGCEFHEKYHGTGLLFECGKHSSG